MGLDVAIGMLADLNIHEPEEADGLRADIAHINAHLRSLGLRPHVEPEECESWSWDAGPYSAIDRLRQLAARLDRSLRLPETELTSTTDDPILEEYYARLERVPSLVRRLLGLDPRRGGSFDHLINHSGCDGYYLPTDFSNVLSIPPTHDSPALLVGSAPALLRELERLAAALGLPSDRTPETMVDLYEPAHSPSARHLWQRHPTASYCCVVLMQACREATRSGSLLGFC